MIVHDFNVIRTVTFPRKTDSPLVVDPDTVLSGLSPDNFSNLFPRLAARSPSFTALSSITSLRSAAFLKPENCLTLSPEEILRFPVFEASDH